MNLKCIAMLALLFVSLSCLTAQKSVSSGDQTAGSAPVQVGEKAPDFTLEDQERKKVTLSSRLMVTVLCSAVS